SEEKLSEALAHAEEANRLEPKDGRPLTLLGDLYQRQGRTEKAKDSCRRALQNLSSEDPTRQIAQKILDQLEGKPPDDAATRLHLARTLARDQRWRDAAVAYAELFRAAPADDGEAWFECAAVRLLAGDVDGYRQACKFMRECCGKNPAMRPY